MKGKFENAKTDARDVSLSMGDNAVDTSMYSVVIADAVLGSPTSFTGGGVVRQGTPSGGIDLKEIQKLFPRTTVASTNQPRAFAQADVVVLPLKIGTRLSFEWLWELNQYAQVVIMDRTISVSATAHAMHQGVADVVGKPISTARLKIALERAVMVAPRVYSSLGSFLTMIFKTMERMNQIRDEMRLVHLLVQTIMREVRSGGAVIFKEHADHLAPVKSVQTDNSQPLFWEECKRIGDLLFGARQLRPTQWNGQGLFRLEHAVSVTHLGLVNDVLALRVPAEPQPYICVFLQPHLMLLQRLSLDILISLAQHTGGSIDSARQYQQIAELIYVDDVTELYNARYLPIALEQRVKAFEKSGTVFSVLFLDIDHFKNVNDKHGHLVGSSTLVKVAGLVRRSVRYGDLVFRYGGDEFVVILDGADADGALLAAERIRYNLEKQVFESNGVNLSVTVSIGVSSFPAHSMNVMSIVEQADKAMYEGKKKSRNVVLVA